MSVQLLDKTRKINKLLHNNNSSKVVFNDICGVLTEILDSNVLVVSRKGKILGVSKCSKVREINELITESVGSHIDKMLNERLLSILSTKENVNLETLGFSPDAVKGCEAIITPIDIAGERLGTLFIYKQDDTYSIDDIILSEYGTAVVGLEMLRSVNEESAEETRKEHIVQSAISTLSFSELEAIIHGCCPPMKGDAASFPIPCSGVRGLSPPKGGRRLRVSGRRSVLPRLCPRSRQIRKKHTAIWRPCFPAHTTASRNPLCRRGRS